MAYCLSPTANVLEKVLMHMYHIIQLSHDCQYVVIKLYVCNIYSYNAQCITVVWETEDTSAAPVLTSYVTHVVKPM